MTTTDHNESLDPNGSRPADLIARTVARVMLLGGLLFIGLACAATFQSTAAQTAKPAPAAPSHAPLQLVVPLVKVVPGVARSLEQTTDAVGTTVSTALAPVTGHAASAPTPSTAHTPTAPAPTTRHTAAPAPAAAPAAPSSTGPATDDSAVAPAPAHAAAAPVSTAPVTDHGTVAPAPTHAVTDAAPTTAAPAPAPPYSTSRRSPRR